MKTTYLKNDSANVSIKLLDNGTEIVIVVAQSLPWSPRIMVLHHGDLLYDTYLKNCTDETSALGFERRLKETIFLAKFYPDYPPEPNNV